MITGTALWLSSLQSVQKYALYAISIPALGIFLVSFVPSKANVTIA